MHSRKHYFQTRFYSKDVEYLFENFDRNYLPEVKQSFVVKFLEINFILLSSFKVKTIERGE